MQAARDGVVRLAGLRHAPCYQVDLFFLVVHAQPRERSSG